MHPFRTLLLAAAIAAPTQAQADTVRIASAVPVDVAIRDMTAAVEKAGACIFTVVDFAAGSKAVGNALRPTTLMIFGSPKIGADALLDGQTMGLYLPLKVLAYQDENDAVWLIYDDPKDAAREHGIPEDHPAVANMANALQMVTAAATKTN